MTTKPTSKGFITIFGAYNIHKAGEKMAQVTEDIRATGGTITKIKVIPDGTIGFITKISFTQNK